jgi:RNA polymerase sigma-70 factor, ECF subfamily
MSFSQERKDTENFDRMADSDNQISILVKKAGAGNKACLEELVKLFREDIFRMVYYRVRSRMDAEDLTQDILLQMMKHICDLKEADRFRPWLFRIAVNRVMDFHRKKKLLAFLGTAADVEASGLVLSKKSENPENDMLKKEFRDQFRKFAESLSRWEREVFLLRFSDHLGIKEIADTLKKNESTVKTHLYRALKKFRENSEFRDMITNSYG